jgi:preprotein translocase subunit SecD
MRALAVVALVAGCGSAEPAKPVKIDKGVHIRYSLDLDAVADRATAMTDAARVVQHRLDRAKVIGNAFARGELLVVELAAASAEELERAQDLIGRTGKFEVRVIDSDAAITQTLYLYAKQDRYSRIGVDMAQWQAPNGTRGQEYFLVGPERRDLEIYIGGLRHQDPALAVPADRMLGYERIERDDRTRYWRTYLLERTVRLANRDIKHARPLVEPSTKRPSVMIELTDEPARAFGVLTRGIVGKKIAILIDDRVVNAPIIAGPIDRGKLSIVADDANDLAIVLASGALPAPVRMEVKLEIDGNNLVGEDENGDRVTGPR